MKPFGLAVREAFMGAKTTITTKISKGFAYGAEAPELTFRDYINYVKKVPQLQNGLSSYKELIISGHININTDDENAKKLIEQWNDETGFYDKLDSVVMTWVICGVAMLEKLDEEKTVDVLEVDIRSITGKQRDDFGRTIHYEQSTATGGTTHLDPKKFIEFEYQNISRDKWAVPPHHALCVPRVVGNRVTPSILDSMITAEDAMTSIIANNAYPIEYHVFEGAGDEELEKQNELLRKHRPGDKRVTNRKPEIVISETKGDSKYQAYQEHMDKTLQIGIQFPIEIQTGDFTSRASSDTTHTLLLQKVKSKQRYLANKLKTELYDPILSQNGFNPKTVNLQVSFGSNEVVSLDAMQTNTLRTTGALTLNEQREYLKQHTDLDLFEDNEIKAQAEQRQKELDDQKKQFANQMKESCELCQESQHALCTGKISPRKKCKCTHESQTVSDQDLNRMKAKYLKKLAEKEHIDLS